MYSINRDRNTIVPLKRARFKDLKFGERQHLQEWLAKHPEALGDLLIIQKEFDGFDGTRERLDLLALDNRGHLVVIENKLDDSGRDVIWQALKYAAYCSTLKTSQIVEIYSRYLGKPVDAAREVIAEFLNVDDAEELTLNTANSQRIIFVAASFRSEITATALWLLGKGVNITCFQATPFTKDDELFLTIDQIIPPKEASDYMIQLAEKSAMEETESTAQSTRHARRRRYWDELMSRWEKAGTNILSGRTATYDNWISTGSGTSGVHYSVNLLRNEVRVQLNIESSDADRNNRIFDWLSNRRNEIEGEYGYQFNWHNRDGAKSSRLIHSYEIDTTTQENWPEAIEWQRHRLEAMIATFSPYIKEIAAL